MKAMKWTKICRFRFFSTTIDDFVPPQNREHL
jgi:hypothetical protein